MYMHQRGQIRKAIDRGTRGKTADTEAA